MTTANAIRGEARLDLGDREVLLRPSFSALVAAEDELGPLFALVERAAGGGLTLSEMAGLFWHTACGPDLDRDAFEEAVVAGGLVRASPALKMLLTQILAGK